MFSNISSLMLFRDIGLDNFTGPFQCKPFHDSKNLHCILLYLGI